MTRKSAALAVLALAMLTPALRAQGPANAGDSAWRRGSWREAMLAYMAQVERGEGGDTALLNAGTAALAAGDTALAKSALERAAQSLDPEVRFRGLYNLGLLALRRAHADKPHADASLAEARDRYREALLLRPGDGDAKWNLELAVRQLRPPTGGGGGNAPPPPQQQQRQGRTPPPPAPGGLTQQQAAEILNSIAQEEAATRASLQRRRGRPGEARGVKDW